MYIPKVCGSPLIADSGRRHVTYQIQWEFLTLGIFEFVVEPYPLLSRDSSSSMSDSSTRPRRLIKLEENHEIHNMQQKNKKNKTLFLLPRVSWATNNHKVVGTAVSLLIRVLYPVSFGLEGTFNLNNDI